MELNIKNPTYRKLVYKSVKETYEKWLSTPEYMRDYCDSEPQGFCIAVDRASDIIDNSIFHCFFLHSFNELYLFRKYGSKKSIYWFPRDDKGFWKRVSILNHAIRMCDYPWTIPVYKLLIRFKLIRLGL